MSPELETVVASCVLGKTEFGNLNQSFRTRRGLQGHTMLNDPR